MRVATFLVVLATAFAGPCDTSTCYMCINQTGCSWYNGPAGYADCRETTNLSTSLGLTAATTCPPCQAGTCTECAAINATNNCSWFTSSIFGGTCGNISSPPTSTGITYTQFNSTCPACKDSTACDTCTSNPLCAWYVLPGGVGNKCRDSSPGFAYTKVTSSYCNDPNPCAGATTCNACKNVTVDNETVCSWYKPKSGMEVLYNPKCDLGAPGTVEGAFYDVASSCPPCSGTSCASCKAESGCKWVAVVVATLSSFGQCLPEATQTPGGKTAVGTCPNECDIYSCAGCIAKPDCTWYSGGAFDDTCDRSSDSSAHPFTTRITGTSGTCPPCKGSRCFECNNEAGCGWYLNTVPGLNTDIPGSGDCAPTPSPHPNARLVPNTDAKCDGAQSGAATFAPGFLGFLVAVFLYHN